MASGMESSSVCVSSHIMESVSVFVSAVVEAGDEGVDICVSRAWDREGEELVSGVVGDLGVRLFDCLVGGLCDNLMNLEDWFEGDLFWFDFPLVITSENIREG